MTDSPTILETAHTDPEAKAWALLLAARAAVESGSVDSSISLGFDASAEVVRVGSKDHAEADLTLELGGEWLYSTSLSDVTRDLLELYLPAIGTPNRRSVVVGHLGQSIDARIATVNGDAFFVTGDENRKHLHRMRALSHAVIVGVGTVLADNPQLTTRSVSGESPVRVVIDPYVKIPADAGLLNDGAAPTLLIHAQSARSDALATASSYERIFLPSVSGRFDVAGLVEMLTKRGLDRLFVEGGGVTVSGFFQVNQLHRLQIATAPLLVGEGRPAIQLPGVLSMKEALRPPARLYRMGEDVLWDFDLRNGATKDEGRQRSLVERLL